MCGCWWVTVGHRLNTPRRVCESRACEKEERKIMAVPSGGIRTEDEEGVGVSLEELTNIRSVER